MKYQTTQILTPHGRMPGDPAPRDPVPRAALPHQGGELRSSKLPLAAQLALGGLTALLDRPEMRDLFIHAGASGVRVWADSGSGNQQVKNHGLDRAGVAALAVKLIACGGRQLDELHPCQDVKLGDGIRVHAVLGPVSVSGATISIRLPRVHHTSFGELVEAGLCDHKTAKILTAAVSLRKNILITGGTGSGKTTLLAALLDMADPADRIITIEDLAEIRLTHEHTVSLEARTANSEAAGAVSVQELLIQALRMRPNRIVLGECRGAEIVTLLNALNTGHDGGAGTLHASSIRDVPARLEALGASAGMEPTALAKQVISAVDLVVHLQAEHGRHRVEALGTPTLQADQRLGIAVK